MSALVSSLADRSPKVFVYFNGCPNHSFTTFDRSERTLINWRRKSCPWKRDGAARLARGAHNPKVGSSNLPPATIQLPTHDEAFFKAIWSIRNLSKESQKTYAKILNKLSRNTDLNEPERVERYIFDSESASKTKSIMLDSYSHYCKANQISWIRPSLKTESAPIKIPLEENIDRIISSASISYAAIFHLSKYGLRPDEISKVTLRDLDLEKKELVVRTSKLGLQRTLRLKEQTADLLRNYLRTHRCQQVNNKIFPTSKTIKEKWRFCARDRSECGR